MSQQAVAGVAQQFAARSTAKAGAPLRSAFLVNNVQPFSKTPMAGLLTSQSSGSGGRGGRTRLALLLSLLWVNASPPHSSVRAARWWAELIGLPEPATKGVRAVTSNFHELHRRGFITLNSSTDGRPSRVDLLNETGSGQPYQLPYIDREHYNRIPETLWTTRKIAELDGRALAMFLVLLYYQRDAETWTWFSSDSFRQRHSLSDNLRTKGLNLLVDAGVAQMKEAYVDADVDGEYRTTRRRWYQLLPTYQPPKTRGKPMPKRTRTSDDDLFDRMSRAASPDPWSSTPQADVPAPWG